MSPLLVAPMQIGAKTGYATPVYIDSTQIDGVGASLAVAAPAGVAVGDLLFALCVDTAASLTWTPPAGWTLVASYNTSDTIAIFKKTATGSEPGSYSFGNGGGGSKWIAAMCYRGATTISANNLAGVTIAGADPQIAASMAVVKDRILLAICELGNASVTLTSGPAGMTSREQQFSGGSPRGAIYDLVNPSTGASGTKSFDISTSIFGCAFLVEIQ